MKSKRTLALAAMVALGGAGLAACGATVSPASSSTAISKAQTGPIVIGAAIAKTGWMTIPDQTSMDAFMMVINQVNASGGIHGRKIKVITGDSQTSETVIKQVTSNLIGQGAKIIVATCNYDIGSPAGIEAQSDNILNVSLCAGSPLWGTQGIGPQAYTAATADYAEGWAIAQFIKEQGWSRPFVLDDESLDYSKQVCTGFDEHWQELGGKVAGTAQFMNGDASIATQVGSIQSVKPDVIVACTYTPGGTTAIRDIRAAGLTTPIVSDFGMTGTDWLNAVPHLSNFYVTANASLYGDDPDPKVNQFVKQYVALYGSSGLQNTSVTVGYTCAQMIVDALEKDGGNTDGPALSAVLDKFTNYPTLLPTTYTPSIHINAKRPIRILRYTNGTPAFFKMIDITGNVDLHL